MEPMPLNILLVEDNPADADLTIETLSSSKIFFKMDHVEDGVEAMEYLRKEGQYSEADRPDLVLLDLNLPRMDGREVLDQIKKDVSLRQIPVVILTSSEAEEYILKSYDMYANAYVKKPVDLKGFGHICQSIESFWLSVVKLPPKH